MPWNYPYYQVARFAGPNLVLGNTIVLKHAPQCPESAAALQQIFLDAGYPEGAYVNVYATNEQIAEAIADPRVQGVSLTGSERAGAAVAEIAGRNLKKVVLELGGSDPFILLSSDDLDATVEAAIDGRFENTGQACNAAKRFIVADSVYDDFLEKFTAKVREKADGLAPLSSVAAAERLAEQVDRAVADGATLVSEGERKGAFFPPGVLTNVSPDSASYKRGAVRPRGHRLQGVLRGRGRRTGQRHPVRPWLVRVHHRHRSGQAGSRQDRCRNGFRQCRRRRGRRAAVRRRQALRLRTRAGPLRHRRVRQQEAHQDHLRLASRKSCACGGFARYLWSKVSAFHRRTIGTMAGGIASELAAAGFDDAVEVGRGGGGVVYRCYQKSLGRSVAIKVLASDLDEDDRERFLREGYAMGGLSGHPNIVNILQVGVTESNRPFIVMPYHAVGSLAERVRREGRIAWPEALRIGVKLCGALETAHRTGTLHRDIKPANVLVNDYGEPQLSDFGTARIAGGYKTVTGFFTGTLSYTAPEVLAGNPPTVAADVYSLGATIYALIAGSPPHERKTDEELIAHYLRITSTPVPDLRPEGIPADVCAAIEKAMSLEPAER